MNASVTPFSELSSRSDKQNSLTSKSGSSRKKGEQSRMKSRRGHNPLRY